MGSNTDEIRGTLRVLVIGGANTDIVGVSDEPVVSADSNPGHARITPGGVARNVAANLARMGVDVSLITAFGTDAYGRRLAEECRAAGIDVSRSLAVEGSPGSVYLAIIDHSGELVSAVSDMRALEALTPDALRGAVEGLGRFDGVFVDANLAEDTLDAAVALFDSTPVFADSVSAPKAPRLAPVLARLEVLKASAAEAEALTGERDPARSANALVERGVRWAWVTAGSAGAFWAHEGERGFARARPVHVVNATGAGDAFMAGVVYATLRGWNIERSARFATGAAAVTLVSEETVSSAMSIEAAQAGGERDE